MNKLFFIRDSIKNETISHQYIRYFITMNNITYSENKNGMFINLSKMDNTMIDKLHEYIVSYNNMDTNNNHSIEYYKSNKPPVIIKPFKKKYKKMESLTTIEQTIIKLSKDI